MGINKIKKASFCLIGMLLAISVQAQLKEEKAFVTAFNKSLQSKDTTGLALFLASNFSVAGHTGEGAKYRLNQIIKNYAPASVTRLSNKKHNRGTVCYLEFTDKKGKKIPSQLLLDKAGQIVYIKHFDSLYGMEREDRSRLVAQIPFENHNGSIILNVKINRYARPLRLLFDTGADGMAVSQELADAIGLKVTRENNASVVGGNKTIQVSDGNTVQLDTLSLTDMGIAIFPEMGREYAEGIIGNTLIRRYITHIDYDKGLLSLYTFGDHSYTDNGQIVKIGMPSGVIILPGELEIVKDKSYNGHFVFDTGASYDLICFRPFVRKNKLLVSGFKAEEQSSTVSMGISSPTFIGRSYRFAISPLPAMETLPVSLMGGSGGNEQWDPGADGSIGVRLLSRYNMTINLAENELFFSPNRLYELPQDFTIRGYQFGWDNTGILKVLGRVGISGSDGVLKSDNIVTNIGAYSADQLQENPALIEEIRAKASENEKIIIKLSTDTMEL